MTPAEQLQTARVAARLTWEQVSQVTGVPLSTLKNWSSGTQTPAAYTLRAVLDQIAAATPGTRPAITRRRRPS